MQFAHNSVLDKYGKALERATRYIRPNLPAFIILAAITTLLFYFIDLFFEPTYDTLFFRLVGAASCLAPLYLIYTDRSERMISLWFVFSATVLLMWMFPSMLVVNAASLPEGGTLHGAWISMYLVSIFLYIQILSNTLLAVTGWVIGLLLSSLSVLLVDQPNIEAVIINAVHPFSIYLTAIVFGSLLNRHIETVEKDKLAAAKAIGGNIAHELRTPLSGISLRAAALERLLPELTKVYEKAVKNGEVEHPLTRSKIDLLTETASDIKEGAQYSNTVINMLLMNTAEQRFREVDHDTFTAAEILRQAIDNYPFPNNIERDMVDCTGEPCDALIRAPSLLVQHVLFNLIKNGLFYCQEAGRGVVELSARSTERGVDLIVKDTGQGIHPDVLPKIFSRFFTTNSMGRGSGIGLSFCKNVMEDIGGTIDCNSTLGGSATFTMHFPAVENPPNT